MNWAFGHTMELLGGVLRGLCSSGARLLLIFYFIKAISKLIYFRMYE
jgi:hypothetical protein